MTSVVLNGVTYTDDANGSTGMANGGHRVRFVPALANFVIEAATQLGLQHASRDAADASEAAALASEIAAAASALSAVNAPGTTATSTTSDTIALGSTTLTIQTGKAFVVGQFVTIAYTTDATNWMHGVITAHNSGTGSITVNVSASAGGGTYSAWTVALSGPNKSLLLYSARSSNTALAVTDNNTLIDASGTYTQTFEAAATLGNGWWCYVRNAGAGVITLDPNASETIGGAATIDVAVGETYLIQCTGAAFTAVLVEARKFSYDRVAHITSTGGTWTVPANVFAIRAYLFGAGGNGASGGGGGGSCSYGTIPTAPGTVFTFTVAGTVITLNVGGTTYLTSNSGSNGSGLTGGAGGTAGSVAGGLGIADSGAYAGGAGGLAQSGGGKGGGGGAGSPLGTGGTGGAGGVALNTNGGGGGFLYAGSLSSTTASSGGGGAGVGGTGGKGTATGGGPGGGSGGAASTNTDRPAAGGVGRKPGTYFSDVLLSICTSPGANGAISGAISQHAGPGGGGAGGGGACGSNGGIGGGGGASSGDSYSTAGIGGIGGGGGANTSGGGGGGGNIATAPQTGASAGVLIFY